MWTGGIQAAEKDSVCPVCPTSFSAQLMSDEEMLTSQRAWMKQTKDVRASYLLNSLVGVYRPIFELIFNV